MADIIIFDEAARLPWPEDEVRFPSRNTPHTVEEQIEARKQLIATVSAADVWDAFERYMTRLKHRKPYQVYILKLPHLTSVRMRRGKVIGGWWSARIVLQHPGWMPGAHGLALRDIMGKTRRIWFNPETGRWRMGNG